MTPEENEILKDIQLHANIANREMGELRDATKALAETQMSMGEDLVEVKVDVKWFKGIGSWILGILSGLVVAGLSYIGYEIITRL